MFFSLQGGSGLVPMSEARLIKEVRYTNRIQRAHRQLAIKFGILKRLQHILSFRGRLFEGQVEYVGSKGYHIYVPELGIAGIMPFQDGPTNPRIGDKIGIYIDGYKPTISRFMLKLTTESA